MSEVEGVLDPKIRSELNAFEVFLKKIGFKRIHGSIYGLLVLSERPLSSAEIEKELELSQSAVSQGIKILTTYGAVESTIDRQRNCLVHTASLNTLDIVASVFKKRESETILNYKNSAKRVKSVFIAKGLSPSSMPVKRLQSIITTCEIGEAIINFIVTLSELEVSEKIQKVTNRLPQVLKMLATSTSNRQELFDQINGLLGQTIKKGLSRVKGVGRD